MASKVSGIIEKINSNGTSHSIASTAYGYCATVANEPAKTVEMTGFILNEGVTLHIKFEHENTASNPTLNVNTTGAKAIQFGVMSTDVDGIIGWRAGDILEFTYDGTNWVANNAAYATRAGSILSGNIKPIITKEYPAYTCSANSRAKAVLFFGKINIINYTPWQTPWAIHYKIYVSTTENATQGWYDCYFSAQGSTITYYNYNNFYSTDYRPIYHHSLIYPKSGYSSYGGYFGVRVQDARTPTTLARTFKIELLEMKNCTVNILDSIKRYDELYVTTNSIAADTIWYYGEYTGTSVGLQESGDANSNDTSMTYERYNHTRLTCTTIYPRYTLSFTHPTDSSKIIPVNTTENTTAATKTTITNEAFNIFDKIYYKTSAPSTVLAANSLVAVGDLWYAYSNLDLRYSFNLTTSSLTAHKDVYLVCNLVSPTTATLRGYDQTGDNASVLSNNKGPITQTLPSSEDGLIYIKLGRSYSAYQITLMSDHPIYWFKNGAVRLYSDYAESTNRAAITTTTNAVAYYTNTTGTFGTKASANGALYATSADGALNWGTLPVGQGGTNATSVTKYGIAFGNASANGYTFTATGSDGYILIGKGENTAPTWQEILPIAHGGTGTKTAPTQYGVIYASSTTAYASTDAGSANQILVAGDTDAPRWTAAAFLSSITNDTANTEGWTTLTLGNANPTNTASNSHSRGELKLYSDGSTYTSIRAQSGYSKEFYLPAYNDNMYAVHVGDNNAVGDTYTPVYIAANGRATVTCPVQYFTWTIASGKSGVTLTGTNIFTTSTYNVTLVITSGEENLNGPITWISAANTFTIQSDTTTSGAVSGYAIVARGTDITSSLSSTDVT